MKNKPAVPRARFDDVRSPDLLEDLLGSAESARHFVIVQIGMTIQFRWEATEPAMIEHGSAVDDLPVRMPRHIAKELPRGWVVTEVARASEGLVSSTLIRLGPPELRA